MYDGVLFKYTRIVPSSSPVAPGALRSGSAFRKQLRVLINHETLRPREQTHRGLTTAGSGWLGERMRGNFCDVDVAAVCSWNFTCVDATGTRRT